MGKRQDGEVKVSRSEKFVCVYVAALWYVKRDDIQRVERNTKFPLISSTSITTSKTSRSDLTSLAISILCL
jgi:hypothetical protein